MSRFHELLDKYQDQEESDAEAEELARLLKDDDGRARTFYDAIMLEVDLYESYAGIARIQAAPKRRWRLRQWMTAWAAMVLMVLGLVAVLRFGSPKPPQPVDSAPPAGSGKIDVPLPAPKVPEPTPPPPVPGKRVFREKDEHDREHEREHEKDRDKGGRRAKIEREMDEEIEKARKRGDLKEMEEKIREKERKLNTLERRGDD